MGARVRAGVWVATMLVALVGAVEHGWAWAALMPMSIVGLVLQVRQEGGDEDQR